MHVKFNILNLSKCIYLNIVFCFNRMLWCTGNVERTWDMTPQKELQFYKNELDVKDRFGVIWEPSLSRYYRLYPQFVEKDLRYGGPGLYCSVLRLWRYMFQIESSVSSGLRNISLMSSTNWLR